MHIKVTHHIDELADDLRGIAVKAPKDLRGCVKEGLRVGNTVAKDNAKRTAGKHGKHYHRAFTSQMNAGGGLFGGTYSGEYGPEVGRPQGRMSFEFGSRNQPPHLDLAKSADLVGPALAAEVRAKINGWFW